MHDDWSPMSVPEIRDRFAAVSIPWGSACGLAIELLRGKATAGGAGGGPTLAVDNTKTDTESVPFDDYDTENPGDPEPEVDPMAT